MSQKTLTIYIKTTGKPEKRNMLREFGQGAERHGVKVNYYEGYDYQPSDYAIIFGFKARVKSNIWPNGKESVDLRLKLYDQHKDRNVFFMDSDVYQHFNRSLDPDKNIVYHRYPYKSIYPHEADYFLYDLDKERIKQFNIPMLDYRKNGDHILLLLNRGLRGFSSFGLNSYEWAINTINELKKYTDRKFVVRPHNIISKNDTDPKDAHFESILRKMDKVRIVDRTKESIDENHKNAWASVSYTTTASAVSLAKGIPTFTTTNVSYLHEFSSGELKDIENPKLIDRTDLLHKYANSHWSLKEVKEGIFWDRIKKYLK